MPILHIFYTGVLKGMQIRHLLPLLRFIPQFAQICIIFALSKFEANPFFRPVGNRAATNRARIRAKSKTHF